VGGQNLVSGIAMRPIAPTGEVHAGQSALPLSASTMHALTSTASNADAGTVLS
jgi:hypothetical protein